MHDPYPRAEQLFRMGRFDEARRAALEALGPDPERSDALRLLALASLRLGDEDEADRAARQAIGAAPDDAYAHYVHALVLLERGRVDEAPLRLGEAIRLAPFDSDLHALKAAMHVAWSEWPAADEAAARALAIDPEHASALASLARIRIESGELDDAEAVLRTALARHPDDADLHRLLGESLRKLGRTEEAADSFAAATHIDPTDTDATSAFSATTRAAAPGIGRLHAALDALDEWLERFGTAALILAPFLVWFLHLHETADDPPDALLPPAFMEWSFFGLVIALHAAGPLSTVIWRRSAVRAARIHVIGAAASLAGAIVLLGAGPARMLPALGIMLAACTYAAAAGAPPGPDRRRGGGVAGIIAALAFVGVAVGVARPPLPVDVTALGFLVAWSAHALFARGIS